MTPEPTFDQVVEAVKVNPMRMLNRFACRACGYAWQQPAEIGTCPRCHEPDAERYASIACMLPRT